MAPRRQVVKIEQVTVLLGGFPALARCDFDVFEAEIVLIAGSNGSGKTTLLKLCAGICGFREGSVRVFGVDMKGSRADVRKFVGYVGHATLLYNDLTVRENLKFIASCLDIPFERAFEYASEFGLSGKMLDQLVGTLSAGQRKRVSLAAAFSRECELLLLDEPHASLDHEGKEFLEKVSIRFRELGRSVVVASHEFERMESIADRRYQMDSGRALKL
jgi:ABC-type multidrug transport system ATPase subunit